MTDCTYDFGRMSDVTGDFDVIWGTTGVLPTHGIEPIACY